MSIEEKDLKTGEEETPTTVSIEEFKKTQKALEDYKKDMHEYKTKLKAKEQEAAEYAAQAEVRERENLKKQEDWKGLAERYEAQNIELTKKMSEKDKKIYDSLKKNAVISLVGGFKKPEYSKFIDTEKVLINEDGTINQQSLDMEVDRLRQTSPELLKSHRGTTLPNDQAPGGSKSTGKKSYKEMNAAEKEAYRLELLKKSQTA